LVFRGPPLAAIARSDIAIQGFGDTRLLFPTGPQVREPQNRRVQIVIK